MNLHGVLLVNKPEGCTSHDIVDKVRRIVGQRQVGHAGTLDPMATGLLVLLLGEATKISDYLLNSQKGYRAKIKFGIETDTLDRTGEVLREQPVVLDPELIAAEAKKLLGVLQLEVPKFSAVKVGGVKLVNAARKKVAVQTPTRPMEFIDLTIHEVTHHTLDLDLHCEKGAYIRAWAHQLGQNLGCGAVLESLQRIYSAPFDLNRAVNIEDLSSPVENIKAFIPLAECLSEWKAFTIRGRDVRLMANGQIPHDLAKRWIIEQKSVNALQRSMGVRIFEASSGQLLSLVEILPNRAPKIKRVFNYA